MRERISCHGLLQIILRQNEYSRLKSVTRKDSAADIFCELRDIDACVPKNNVAALNVGLYIGAALRLE